MGLIHNNNNIVNLFFFSFSFDWIFAYGCRQLAIGRDEKKEKKLMQHLHLNMNCIQMCSSNKLLLLTYYFNVRDAKWFTSMALKWAQSAERSGAEVAQKLNVCKNWKYLYQRMKCVRIAIIIIIPHLPEHCALLYTYNVYHRCRYEIIALKAIF